MIQTELQRAGYDEPQERHIAYKNMLWILSIGQVPTVRDWQPFHLKRTLEERRRWKKSREEMRRLQNVRQYVASNVQRGRDVA